MLIQILDVNQNDYEPNHLIQFKENCNSWANKYGMEKLKWLHSENIDLNCDVFLKSVDTRRVLIGYINNITPDYSADELRWLEIEIVGPMQFDAITQILMVTAGMIYIPSVSGFSVDWEDIQTVLNYGSKGYCCTFDWSDLHLVMDQAEKKLSQTMKITSSAMLLNQGLGLKETFKHVENLVKTNTFSKKCFEVLNITTLEEFPLTNIFLFIGEDISPRFINISNTNETSSDKIKTLH